MQQGNISLNVFLSFLINPLFKVNEVKSMWVINFILFQPLYKIWEMVQDFFTMENSINHMTTEKSHFNFVSQM